MTAAAKFLLTGGMPSSVRGLKARNPIERIPHRITRHRHVKVRLQAKPELGAGAKELGQAHAVDRGGVQQKLLFSVVIHHLHIQRVPAIEAKARAPLVVDANAVRPLPVILEGFAPVVGRSLMVLAALAIWVAAALAVAFALPLVAAWACCAWADGLVGSGFSFSMGGGASPGGLVWGWPGSSGAGAQRSRACSLTCSFNNNSTWRLRVSMMEASMWSAGAAPELAKRPCRTNSCAALKRSSAPA